MRDRFNAEKRFAEALWNFLICLKVEASSTSANSSQTWEKANDQIDRFCCLRLSRHNLSTGNDGCAGSRAGRHDHASRLRLRPVQDTSWWCLRRQDHHPPCAPRSPQVCAMARRRLRSVGLLKRLAASKLLFLRSGSALRQAQPRDGYLNLRNCGWPPLGYSEVRSWQIVLKKSFLTDERIFLEPLVRSSCGDVRDHIVSHKKRPQTAVSVLQGVAAAETTKKQDFRGCSIFDFCNSIGTFETCRRTPKMSATRARPEVTGARSERRD